jgi:hypothetical protein
MLKPEFIRGMKQKNISKNAEKTKERIRATWQPLKKQQREELLALADMSKITVERAYKTGGASAKIIIAFAQTLDIDPRYLTGEIDEQGYFNKEIAINFLTDLGYKIDNDDFTRQKKVKAKSTKKSEETKTASETSAVYANEECVCQENKDTSTMPLKEEISAIFSDYAKKIRADNASSLDNLTEDDITLLLKSLNLQAKYSDEKSDNLMLIKYLLLL